MNGLRGERTVRAEDLTDDRLSSQFRPDRDAGRVAWLVAVYLTRLCA